MDQTQGRILFGLAMVGTALSTYLTYVHLRLLQEPGWRSACEISGAFSCGTALLSPYSSIGGVPLAFLGLCFYASAAAIAGSGMRTGRRGRPRSPAAVLFCMSMFSVLLSVALAMISAFAIGAFCAFCVGLYTINLSMLGVAWRAFGASGEDLRNAVLAERRYWRRHPNRGWITSTLLGVGVFAMMLLSKIHCHEASASFCEAVAKVPRSGPIELVIFSDFQCLHCQKLDRSLRAFRTEARLETVLRHYPLDSACNPDVKSPLHPDACLQARAAICAATEGRDKEFADRLFDSGETDQKGLVKIAVSLGLEEGRFASCLAAEETSRELEASIAEARVKGVKSTPTVLVNGRKYVGRLSEEDLACLQQSLRN